MKEKVLSTLKSSETDDWLDIHVVRPFAYYWALFFNLFDIHPNTVTIISMVVGAASALFFAHGSFFYEGTAGLVNNIIAIVLLCLADILDCTDGQLARMTGKKSRLGRILDGLAGFTWFVPIYVILLYRIYTYHDIEFGWLGIENTPDNSLILGVFSFFLILISGVVCFSGQSRLADYYIQVHLFFLKGEKGSELDSSEKQKQLYGQLSWKGNFVEKLFLLNYVSYTRSQEKTTPEFQKLLTALREKFGSESNIPQEIRQRFHDSSLPVMTLNGLLTFNFRSAFLFLFVLIDTPLLFFVFEVVFMSLLAAYINHRHESFCREIRESLA